MKVFMITWGLLCFLVIVWLFIAYATDNFPGVPVPKAEHAQGEILTEEECSPCEENLKRLKAAMENASREHEASVNAENRDRVKKASVRADEMADALYHERNAENRDRVKKAAIQYLEAVKAYHGEGRFSKIQQLIDEYGTKEGLRRFIEMGPESAERFERERRGAPSRDVPKADGYSDDEPPDDSP